MTTLSINIKWSKDNFTLDMKANFSDGITGIFGASGAGKSSLLQLIAGLERLDEGQIAIGNDILDDSETKTFTPSHKRKIGYVFQEGRLFPHMNVHQNLLFATRYIKKDKQQISLEEVVQLLEIDTLLTKFPKQLSGGEKQRVAIGRSLLSSPRLLLMDEPFSALDASLRRQIIPYLIKINQKLKLPILVVSHDLPDLLNLSQKLLLVKDGQIIAQGNYLDLIEQDLLIDIMEESGLNNMIPFKIEHIDTDYFELSKTTPKGIIKIKRNKQLQHFEKGDEINVSLRPEDIAIALNQIKNVSIRNQLEGTILQIIKHGNQTYCLVDVGFKLLVTITETSRQSLKLFQGEKVWCLFKSMALKVNV
ncbi:molybdate transport system ATP-binding protein [Ancylomarina subtilis]|uniref:Molybdate transport system ATP-binding protein n=1 Tax=Ancylomarina subtilis TaxID=1639035 RepID=A0A4Q7VHY0_9BACT|nr:molybdenum ABC transporter ATP-binding protein [Ancylomarina subtilis]RZT95538.1 molybdate transport system ATP-binding protein [Ancylomarina subtilis]